MICQALEPSYKKQLIIQCHENLTQLVSCNPSSFPASQGVVLPKAVQNSFKNT